MILQILGTQRVAVLALAAVASLVAVLGLAGPARGLTLDEAIERALTSSPQVTAAQAQARAASAQAGAASTSRLPRLTAELSGQRSDHPVFAFGSLLAQKQFTAADFGTIDFGTGALDLSTLNTPDPVTNFRAALMVEQPIWTGGAITSGLHASRARAEAARAMAQHTQEQIAFDTERAYRGAVLSQVKLDVLRESLAVARAEGARVEKLWSEGLALESDRLALSAFALETEAALAGASAESVEARSQLALLLGEVAPISEALAPPPMTEPADTGDTALEDAALERSDVRAARSAWDAARAQISGARSRFFPSVAAHAGVEHNSDKIFGEGGDQWLVGMGARWSFDLGVPSQTSAASAQADAARRQAELAAQGARHEVRVAQGRLNAARGRARALTQALTAAQESFRLVRERHAEGLSTANDLMTSQNTFTRTRLEARHAEHDVMLAWTALRLASGTMHLPEAPR